MGTNSVPGHRRHEIEFGQKIPRPIGGTVSSGDTTVSKLASVIVPVKDQDRQLEFYTEVLGLET
jgi:hypothetical protein